MLVRCQWVRFVQLGDCNSHHRRRQFRSSSSSFLGIRTVFCHFFIAVQFNGIVVAEIASSVCPQMPCPSDKCSSNTKHVTSQNVRVLWQCHLSPSRSEQSCVVRPSKHTLRATADRPWLARSLLLVENSRAVAAYSQARWPRRQARDQGRLFCGVEHPVPTFSCVWRRTRGRQLRRR